MKFKNTKTGVILELPEDFSGTNWEPVEKKRAPEEAPHRTEPKKPAKKKKEV